MSVKMITWDVINSVSTPRAHMRYVNLCIKYFYNLFFQCGCNEGFMISDSDSEACVDIDECSEDNHGCSHGCINQEGSAHCTCPAGMNLRLDECICFYFV